MASHNQIRLRKYNTEIRKENVSLDYVYVILKYDKCTEKP